MISVLSTEGSTYSKAGNQMLVNSSGDFRGMLSGGCLEGDLAERSIKVINNEIPEVFTYDLRGDDDIFGLGVGCDGLITILIQPLNKKNEYQPFRNLLETLEISPNLEILQKDMDLDFDISDIKAPVRILILGAGIDVDPLVTFGVLLGWDVSVSDYRPAFLKRMKENIDVKTLCIPHTKLDSELNLSRFDAGAAQAYVHLSAGEWEGDHLAPFQTQAPDAAERLKEKAKTRTIAAAQEMAAALSKHPGLTADYETYGGENHMSVLPVAVNRAIQRVFALS